MNMVKIIEKSENNIEIETDARHITVQTRAGEINIFVGSHRRSITSFISNVVFTTWYDENPTKVSKFKTQDGRRMVILGGKQR